MPNVKNMYMDRQRRGIICMFTVVFSSLLPFDDCIVCVMFLVCVSFSHFVYFNTSVSCAAVAVHRFVSFVF